MPETASPAARMLAKMPYRPGERDMIVLLHQFVARYLFRFGCGSLQALRLDELPLLLQFAAPPRERRWSAPGEPRRNQQGVRLRVGPQDDGGVDVVDDHERELLDDEAAHRLGARLEHDFVRRLADRVDGARGDLPALERVVEIPDGSIAARPSTRSTIQPNRFSRSTCSMPSSGSTSSTAPRGSPPNSDPKTLAALHDRVLQATFWTQETKGNLMGAMYERVADPWRARGQDFDSLGNVVQGHDTTLPVTLDEVVYHTRLVARGCTVSTVKHAHHNFDVDTPGKDSHVHRMAGATEVLVASIRHPMHVVEAAKMGADIGTMPMSESSAMFMSMCAWITGGAPSLRATLSE